MIERQRATGCDIVTGERRYAGPGRVATCIRDGLLSPAMCCSASSALSRSVLCCHCCPPLPPAMHPPHMLPYGRCSHTRPPAPHAAPRCRHALRPRGRRVWLELQAQADQPGGQRAGAGAAAAGGECWQRSEGSLLVRDPSLGRTEGAGSGGQAACVPCLCVQRGARHLQVARAQLFIAAGQGHWAKPARRGPKSGHMPTMSTAPGAGVGPHRVLPAVPEALPGQADAAVQVQG